MSKHCICASGWCEAASKLAAEKGLTHLKGSLNIPHSQGEGKTFGPEKEAMRMFVRNHWLRHLGISGVNVPKGSRVRRVHFSNEMLELTSDGLSIDRLFKLGKHSPHEAEVFAGSGGQVCTLVVLPSMNKEEAIAQAEKPLPTPEEILSREEEAAYRHALHGLGAPINGRERAVLAELVDSAPAPVRAGVKSLIRATEIEKKRREEELEQIRQQDLARASQQHAVAIAGEKRKREDTDMKARNQLRDAADRLKNSERQRIEMARAAIAKRKDRDLKDALDDIKRWKSKCLAAQRDLRLEEAKARVYTPTGLCLENLLSSQWHAKNKGAANAYFGHKTLEAHVEDIDMLLPDRQYLADNFETIRLASEAGDVEGLRSAQYKLEKLRKQKLQAATLCVMKMRMKWTGIMLEHISGWGRTKVSQIINKWTPEIEAAKSMRP